MSHPSLIQLALKIYLKLPVPVRLRRKARDLLFEHAGGYFKHHLAYQVWSGERHAPIREAQQLCNRYGWSRPIKAPKDSEWYDLVVAHNAQIPKDGPILDIIIPVYRGYHETLRAVYNAVAAPNQTATHIIVINDASPDREIVKALNRYAGMGLFTLLHNSKNLGFVKTVNRGFDLHSDRDCLILNADCMVYGNYADRMIAVAKSHPHVATVTPLSNNGELCSYPLAWRNNLWRTEQHDAAMDALAFKANGLQAATVPTGVGYCMYMSRAAMKAVGTFDANTFGRGYGEENDFCLRATAAGFIHLMAGGVFVRHVGGSSFMTEKDGRVKRAMKILDQRYPHYHQSIRDWQASDPAKPMREALDLARLDITIKPSILMILHSWGGGTEKHVLDMAKWLEAEGTQVFYMMPVEGDCGSCQLGIIRNGAFNHEFVPNLRFHHQRDAARLIHQLQAWDIRHIHVHHLVGYDNDYYRFVPELSTTLNVAFDITLHDYFSICPRTDLINESKRYCGEPAPDICNQCLAKNGSPILRYLDQIPDIGVWRSMHHTLLKAARCVYVPNEDVAARLTRYFDDISFLVRAHPEAAISRPNLPAPRRPDIRRIGLIGAIYPLKGAHVLKEVLRDAAARNLPLEFYIFGFYALDDPEMFQFGNLVETGRYKEKDLPALVAAANPDCALFLSVWPETFSYTLSQAYQLDLYPVSFDIGAPAERIRACNWGSLMPISDIDHPSAINDHLMALTIPPKPATLAIWEKSATYPNLLVDYYHLDASQFVDQSTPSTPHAKAS